MKSAEKKESEFRQRIREVIPQQAKIRSQSTLVPEEWDAPVVPHQHLSASGGISVVPKDCLIEVLERVRFTEKAAGILLVQAPDELGLRGYPRSLIWCSMSRSALPMVGVRL